MLDTHTDDTIFERLHAAAPGSLEFRGPRKRIMRQTRGALTNARPAHPADPGLFDCAKLAAEAVSWPGGPENP